MTNRPRPTNKTPFDRMFGLGIFEMSAIAVVAVLIYGADLPSAARKLGGRYAELRRNLNDIQRQFQDVTREVDSTINQVSPDRLINDGSDPSSSDAFDQDDEPIAAASAPKFRPPS